MVNEYRNRSIKERRIYGDLQRKECKKMYAHPSHFSL